MTDKRLAVELPGITLKNPIMPASGTFAFGVEHENEFDLNLLGALVTKTTTLEPREGNAWPQYAHGVASTLNAVGLRNPGVEAVLDEKLPALAQKYPDLSVIASIAGETQAEYVELAKRIATAPNVKAIEVNVSCPNVDKGGMEFGVDPVVVFELTQKIKRVVDLPIYVKLSPNVTNIALIAKAAEEGGADALVLINTLMSMRLDLNTRKPVLANRTGGLSGESVHPIAVRMVELVAKAVKIPVIGVGGVYTTDDALELMMAGASAIQVGTANYDDNQTMPNIISELPDALTKYGFDKVTEVTNSLEG
ncbi:dihydroorotate dehydrogenase [Periweissella cryptocerci]|uniref:Dihydroorotate dehydrogenase n=1 Tax=Periweissella cryptocerci TaxID=2506420 RepID=A0A4P6YVD3_9LACO|nr:dihydroorotate dehydrogenase [Periweissella cryptocerci]QBO36799.1 dihydroorotate dehydrogenase [Periweissella cryptocerci]